MLPSIRHRFALRHSFALAAAFTLVGATLFAQDSDAAASSKIDRSLRASLQRGASPQHVIVTVKPGCIATIREALIRHGDRIKREHPFIDALVVDLHHDDVEELAKHPCVLSEADDAEVEVTGLRGQHGPRSFSNVAVNRSGTAPVTSTLRDTLGLPHVATAGSMTGATGVTVAVIDSGIAPSEDFAGRIAGFYDFTRGGIATLPYDDYGHGTHISGLIGSSGKLSNGEFQGIAPDVRLVGLKVLDGNGRGKSSDVIAALDFVTANRAKLNVQIVNLSLGHEIYAPAKYDPLVLAVERASAAGLIVVTSAGNIGIDGKNGQAGYTGITSPGNAPSAITVGAAATANTTTRTDDVIAPYSSRGPTWFDGYAKPNVVAPGDKLVSDTSLASLLYRQLASNRLKAKTGQPMLQLSGTSMAAAVTSGVLALAVQQHNQSGFHRQGYLSPNLAKAMLEFSSLPVAGADWLTQGSGEINAAGVIALAAAIDTSVRPNGWWLRSGITPATTIGGTSYPWSQKVIWGDDVFTGNLLYTSSRAWSADDNIVWGTADDNIVWGTAAMLYDDNIVWGTDVSTVWLSNIVWKDRIVGQMMDDNIVWGTSDDNIVWGTMTDDNIVWGTMADDNIVWGTWDGDNIVWGTSTDDNIVWGTADDNIVWGTDDDNIVWGTSFGGGL